MLAIKPFLMISPHKVQGGDFSARGDLFHEGFGPRAVISGDLVGKANGDTKNG